MASDVLREMSEFMRANRAFEADMSIEAQRAGMEAGVGAFELPGDLSSEDLTIAGVKCRWVGVPESRPERILLYLHGGGYALGSLDTHMELMARIARVCRCRVLGADYRLAPEYPFPAAVEDAVAVFRALQTDRGESKLAIAGDSAGGGLTAASLLEIKASGLPSPSAGVMFSPWMDLACNRESYASRAEQDPMLDAEVALTIAAHYVGDHDPSHPLISPLFGDLAELPPLLIQVGDHEVLLSDSVDFADRAQAAGVDVTLEIWDEAFHVFQSMPMVPEAHEALASMAGFLEQAWEGET
jgi:acetyl esterase/lipase